MIPQPSHPPVSPPADRDAIRATWAAAHGVRLASRSRRCLCSLVRGRRCTRQRDCPAPIPSGLWDHPEAWTRGGRLHALTLQPYDPSCTDLATLASLAERGGLVLDVGGPSWRFPARTTLLVLRRDDDPDRDTRDALRERGRLARVRVAGPWLALRDGTWERRALDGERVAVVTPGLAAALLPAEHRADPLAVQRGLVPSDGRRARSRRFRDPELARAWADERLRGWRYTIAARQGGGSGTGRRGLLSTQAGVYRSGAPGYATDEAHEGGAKVQGPTGSRGG